MFSSRREIKTQLGITPGSGLEVYADMYFDFGETYLKNKGLTFFTADQPSPR